MYLQIESLLTPEQAQSLIELARQTKFVSGRQSNPHNVTKTSLIQDPGDPAGKQASQIALAAIQRSEEVRNFVLPLRIAVPCFARYNAGTYYGPHIDSAFMSLGPQPLRSDVSCTIFLTDPASYEGGDLLVHQGTEILRFKGPPGSAVFYPSTTVHQVMPVTSGERLVMITFIESQVPDQMQRDLLYALGEIRALEALKMDWRNRVQLDYVIQNLLRMWSR